MNMVSHRKNRIIFPFFLMVSFFLLYGVLNRHAFYQACYPEGDHALTALSSLRTLSEAVWTGPYSRLGVRHPSPAIFYILGLTSYPFQFLVSLASALQIAAFLINSVIAGFVVRFLLLGLQSQLATGLFIVVLISVLIQTDSHFLVDTWGPSMIILPMTLFFLTTSVASLGRRDGLYSAFILAALLIGTHVATIAIVVPLLFVSGVLFSVEERPCKKDVALLFISFLVVFSMPLIHWYQVGEHSHLSRLFRFVLESSPAHSLPEAFHYIGGFYRSALRSLVPLPSASYCLLLILLILVCLKARSRFLGRLKLIICLAILLSVMASLNLDSLRLRYLMWWHMGIVGLTYAYILYHALMIAGECVPFLNRLPRSFLAVLQLLCVITLSMHYQFRNSECSDIYQSVIDRVPQDLNILKTVSIKDKERWKAAAASVLSLYETGHPVCVYEWDFMFEDTLQCKHAKSNGVFSRSFRLSFYTHTPKKKRDPDRYLIHRKADISMVYETGS